MLYASMIWIFIVLSTLFLMLCNLPSGYLLKIMISLYFQFDIFIKILTYLFFFIYCEPNQGFSTCKTQAQEDIEHLVCLEAEYITGLTHKGIEPFLIW